MVIITSSANLEINPNARMGSLVPSPKTSFQAEHHPWNSCSQVVVVLPSSSTSPWPGWGSQASVPRKCLNSAGHLKPRPSLMMLHPCLPAQTSLRCPSLFLTFFFPLPFLLVFYRLLSPLPQQYSSFPTLSSLISWHFPWEAVYSWEEL